MHLGNARTALLAWLDARAAGGRMLLRIEDLDPQRSRGSYADLILRDLEWLGLDYDEGPYYQSRRGARYAAVLESLRRRGLVYPCWCSRSDVHRAVGAPHPGDEAPYPGTCRAHSAEKEPPDGRGPAWRFLAPARAYVWEDLVLASQSARADAFGDIVVRRADGAFGYQLAVVIDDAEMGVTRVVRGADLISSTPRQLALYETLEYLAPRFGHVPLVLDGTGKRLAKRTPAATVAGLREAGEDPRTVIGRLAASLGWVAEGQDATPSELLAARCSLESLRGGMGQRGA
ncbi:MAG: tRNA glutamyl-Q(34) synthetase GluQRS [bacterium]|nr:tRNA glutamyl-Q(34) synthetase GluQRS [bacterium]